MWSLRLMGRGRWFDTLETPRLPQILAIRDRFRERGKMEIKYFRTFGRMFELMPARESEVLSAETTLRRLPDELSLPRGYRLLRILQLIPV